ncbi:hypothetical protein Fot_43033 [Forsythia ovata]|uniref:Uncharacterized protein n=1 Tax=Forsythia ovata TaxID=205694 RepID=A0ABD1RMW0_9LAMI
MSSFYFAIVPKLKIRRGGVVDNTSPPPPVPFAASALMVTVLQTPKTMVGSSSFIFVVPVVTSEVHSASSPVGSVTSSENSRPSSKRKVKSMADGGCFAPLCLLL